MATFGTYAAVLTPDHPLAKLEQRTRRPIVQGLAGVVLADILKRTGGRYETTTPLTSKFRKDIREVAELTSDDELLGISELPEVPVSLENCRQLDPQTRVVLFARLDVSPAEIPPRLRRGLPDKWAALRIEEHSLPDGRFWSSMRLAADLPA